MKAWAVVAPLGELLRAEATEYAAQQEALLYGEGYTVVPVSLWLPSGASVEGQFYARAAELVLEVRHKSAVDVNGYNIRPTYVDGDSLHETFVELLQEIHALELRAVIEEDLSYVNLWGFLRQVMMQGADQHKDYMAGNYGTYEEYSARVDAASREREDELRRRVAVLQEGEINDLFRIVAGGLDGDRRRVIAYAEMLAGRFERRGLQSTPKRLREMLATENPLIIRPAKGLAAELGA